MDPIRLRSTPSHVPDCRLSRDHPHPVSGRKALCHVTDLSAANALLQDLIRCPSVTPEDAGVLDVVQTYLEALGFTCTRLVFDGRGSYPVDNLVATRGTKGKHLVFAGHTDVVPAGSENEWTHAPFAGDVAGGEIWGRGAVDMKSGVAAFCAAAAKAVETGAADKGTLSLIITNDEEADSVNGTERVMEWTREQGITFDFALVGEPSSAANLGDRLKVGRRGAYSGTVIVKGKQGHSAYPERAINPMPILARVALLLSATPLDDGSAQFQPSNLEITSIDTGNTATNVIPGQGELSFNVRFNDHWTSDQLEHWIAARIDEVPHDGCEVGFARVSASAESFLCPPSDGLDILDDVIAKRFGSPPEHSTGGGTSDARFIASYCPVVECGLVGNHMHAVDERVPLAEVDGLTEIYHDFISAYFER